uniref:C-type lectin domain-containing protein n=1 Tax=Chelonoidis abingdonii TaxID=106734 RepID=A0A8C0QN32_CHEAB
MVTTIPPRGCANHFVVAEGRRHWRGRGCGKLSCCLKSPPESKLPHVSTPVRLNVRFPAPCCLDGWVGYRGKCYYFSEAEGTWDSSQSFCSSLNASLAGIDTEKDLTFIMRYKGVSEFWIGLKRESAQLWRWVNGLNLGRSKKCVIPQITLITFLLCDISPSVLGVHLLC